MRTYPSLSPFYLMECDRRDFEFYYKNSQVIHIRDRMERVNDLVTAKGATRSKKGFSNYQRWISSCERSIKSLLGIDKKKGYEDYKKQIEEMRAIQEARKGKK